MSIIVLEIIRVRRILTTIAIRVVDTCIVRWRSGIISTTPPKHGHGQSSASPTQGGLSFSEARRDDRSDKRGIAYVSPSRDRLTSF